MKQDNQIRSIEQPIVDDSEDLPLASGAKYDSVRDAAFAEPSFLEEVRDFVLGRTRAGLIFQRLAAAIIGVVTGINVDPILTAATEPIINGGTSTMDLGWIELVLIALSAGITWVTARGIVKGFLNEILLEFQDVIEAVEKAREANSPGGKEITEQERQVIMQELYDCVTLLYKRFIRSWVARLFGLNAKKRNQ